MSLREAWDEPEGGRVSLSEIRMLGHVRHSMHSMPLDLQDKQEKQFIYRHSRSVFELLDADGSHNISAEEFESFGFLFDFDGGAARQVFQEFDVSGDQVRQTPRLSGAAVLRVEPRPHECMKSLVSEVTCMRAEWYPTYDIIANTLFICKL